MPVIGANLIVVTLAVLTAWRSAALQAPVKE
jgi:hypothetical protein